jgi:hypothetical protein
MSADNLVAIVSTVKAPVLECLIHVRHHRALGADRIVMYFDDPQDPALAALQREELVTCVPCTKEHWSSLGLRADASIEDRQVANANHALSLLRRQGFQWFIHIDSDELIQCEGGLAASLETAQAECVRFSIREAVSEDYSSDHCFRSTLFRRRGHQLARLVGWVLCPRAHLRRQYFRGHTASKVALRITDALQGVGIHGPVGSADLREVQVEHILLLHYDCVGLASFQTKWDRRLDGSARAAEMRDNRTLQLNRYAEAKRQGEAAQRELFARTHMLQARDKVLLSMLGLLERRVIDLPKISATESKGDLAKIDNPAA